MSVDALRLLIITLTSFCIISVVAAALVAYFILGGRTAFAYISAIKELVLVALGIVGGAVTGHHVGSDRRKPPEEPNP